MQEHLSTKLTLKSENKYPDCLWMQLEAVPVPALATDSEQLDLYLTVNFNEHWEPLLGGCVKLGLKGGELKLKLDGGEMSLASSELDGSVDIYFGEDRQIGAESDRQGSAEASLAAAEPGVKTDKSQFNLCRVSTKGFQANPAWSFEVKTGESELKGRRKSAKLGTINVTAKSCRIEATFEVSKQDVHLTDAEGLWRHDISPNQHAVLERKLVLFLLETKLKPYLSWAQLCYECTPMEKRPEAIALIAESDLQKTIDLIIAAETKDILELATIAGLNPKIDFAGGNWRGSSLSAIDLNSANFCRANLRGADLTDTELSNANLSSANLSGADLSGADLGNADLSHTDLHCASLALANLSGANLSGANLIEANLSNTNFSGAKVNEARFGKNIGISEEAKLNLKQRKAIFEEGLGSEGLSC